MTLFQWLPLAAAAPGPSGAAQSLSITGMTDYMLLVVYVGSGIYLLYTFFTLKRSQTLLENKILIPSGRTAKGCKDAPGFLTFILPRLLTLALGILVSGALLAVDSLLPVTGSWLTVLLMILPLILLVWYVRVLRHAEKTYW